MQRPVESFRVQKGFAGFYSRGFSNVKVYRGSMGAASGLCKVNMGVSENWGHLILGSL